MPKWIGRWKGGRTAQGEERPVFYIEKMRDKRRYTINLGEISEDDADLEWRAFKKDPHGYAKEREKKRFAALSDEAVTITPDLVTAFAGAMRTKKLSEHYIGNTLHYLEEWTEALLAGRDLRSLRLKDLHDTLDKWPKGRQKRIAALKAFTAFLRRRGALRAADDPTADLLSIQSRVPSPKERDAKSYTAEQLAAVYRHLPLQQYRDAFRVRLMTGMHLSEIERIASGDCQLEPLVLKEPCDIAGTVTFTHKSGAAHTLSLDRRTFDACTRLRARGSFGDLRNEDLAVAAKKAKVKVTVRLANLRHTFITLAAKGGRLVQPPSGGVPPDIIAQIVGHHAVQTTRRFYLGSYTPPMIVLDVKLEHPDDPPTAREPGA